eukprot:TRINITY_DN46267_c0_g1_i1.p1 TRINITY_DN46267_c0_g1~~TRINITY_DN46267_c0_g1_i1.p1  ORF type:complete len:108 (-),score=13.79 TRINITY_DN46267_c0_g1_i1:314-637(-)
MCIRDRSRSRDVAKTNGLVPRWLQDALWRERNARHPAPAADHCAAARTDGGAWWELQDWQREHSDQRKKLCPLLLEGVLCVRSAGAARFSSNLEPIDRAGSVRCRHS